MEVGNVEPRVHLGLSGHDRLGGHYKVVKGGQNIILSSMGMLHVKT